MKPNGSTPYDIAVIGGGIAGAAIARDAALRGLSVVLFEKNTFGSGTSSKSSKLIHGGIRYLDLAWTALSRGRFAEGWKNLRFVFTSLHESRVLRRIAPAWVQPLPLFIPIYTGNRHRRATVYLGCLLYYGLSLLSGGGKMPKFYGSPRTALQVVPDLDPKGLSGGVMIREYLTDDLGLVRAVIGSAAKNDAECRENAEVKSYTHDPKQGLHLLSVLMGDKERSFTARKIIDASGAWVDAVRKANGEKGRDLIAPVAGSHIWVRRFLPNSVLLEAEDGRLFFVINIGDRARVGTTERMHTGSPDKVKPTEEEISYLLRSLKRWFPEHGLEKKDVLGSDAGIRPLAVPEHSQGLSEISREHEIRVGPNGIIHMVGVKLTDHRRAAEEVLDRLVPSLLPYNPKAKRKTSTHRVPL
jgi:glycerol-3-phosphate dehydrogenase